MNGKGGAVQQPLSLNHIPRMIHAKQIRYAHLLERAPHGIDPEIVGMLGVAHRDMPRDALVKAEATENTQRRGQTLPALEAFRSDVFKSGGCHVVDGILIHDDVIGLLIHEVFSSRGNSGSLTSPRQVCAACSASAGPARGDTPSGRRTSPQWLQVRTGWVRSPQAL